MVQRAIPLLRIDKTPRRGQLLSEGRRSLNLKDDFKRHASSLALPDFICHNLWSFLDEHHVFLGFRDSQRLSLVQIRLVHLLLFFLALEIAGGSHRSIESASLGIHRDFSVICGYYSRGVNLG